MQAQDYSTGKRSSVSIKSGLDGLKEGLKHKGLEKLTWVILCKETMSWSEYRPRLNSRVYILQTREQIMGGTLSEIYSIQGQDTIQRDLSVWSASGGWASLIPQCYYNKCVSCPRSTFRSLAFS